MTTALALQIAAVVVASVGATASLDQLIKQVPARHRPTEPVREWYFFTDRATVWRVMPGSWKTDALIAFVFEHKPQDIERFRRARN